jgi:hypothetical protein
MRLFLALFLFSVNAVANSWSDLQKSKTYTLNQEIQLPQQERSSSMLDLMRGDKFFLLDIMGLDQIKVTLFTFRLQKCPGQQMSTELAIVSVSGTSPVVEVGAMVEEECKLLIFVESSELLTKSFFK